MKKYIDPENDRYQYQVVATLNGYTIEVLIIPTGDITSLNPSVAAKLQVAIPKNCRMQSCPREAAEQQLDELAALNGWVPIE